MKKSFNYCHCQVSWLGTRYRSLLAPCIISAHRKSNHSITGDVHPLKLVWDMCVCVSYITYFRHTNSNVARPSQCSKTGHAFFQWEEMGAYYSTTKIKGRNNIHRLWTVAMQQITVPLVQWLWSSTGDQWIFIGNDDVPVPFPALPFLRMCVNILTWMLIRKYRKECIILC